MKIKEFNVERITIDEFADKYDLIMEVHERREGDYYAHFERSDVKEGHILIGKHGNGKTKKEAIADYATEISSQLLVLNAWGGNRIEIYVPILIEKTK